MSNPISRRQIQHQVSSTVNPRLDGAPHATQAVKPSSLLGRCLAHFDSTQTYYKIKRGAMIFFSIPLVGIPIGLLVLYEYIKSKRSEQGPQADQSTAASSEESNPFYQDILNERVAQSVLTGRAASVENRNPFAEDSTNAGESVVTPPQTAAQMVQNESESSVENRNPFAEDSTNAGESVVTPPQTAAQMVQNESESSVENRNPFVAEGRIVVQGTQTYHDAEGEDGRTVLTGRAASVENKNPFVEDSTNAGESFGGLSPNVVQEVQNATTAPVEKKAIYNNKRFNPPKSVSNTGGALLSSLSTRVAAPKDPKESSDDYMKNYRQRRLRVDAFVSRLKAKELTPKAFFEQITSMMIKAGKDLNISDLNFKMSMGDKKIFDIIESLLPRKNKQKLVFGNSKPFEIFLYHDRFAKKDDDDLVVLDRMGRNLTRFLQMMSEQKFQGTWVGDLGSRVESALDNQVQRRSRFSRVFTRRTPEEAIRHYEEKRIQKEAKKLFPDSKNDCKNHVKKHLKSRLIALGL